MLTHIKITSAKPAAKAYNLRDAQGLYLTIKPIGSKLWRYNCRFLDKQKTLHLGPWPALGFADARARRDEALAHVDTNQVRRAYARGEYWDERVRMMQHWSDYLDQLRDGAKILRLEFSSARTV